MLLEGEQRLQAMSLHGVLGKGRLFEPQARDLLPQVLILLVDMAEIDIVAPGSAHVLAHGMEGALERRHRSHDPVAHQGDLVAVGRSELGGTAHLNGQADGLRKQDRNQDKDILESCEEGFHALQLLCAR